MKSEEKKKAIELRKQGYSVNYISKELSVSKSSVSLWINSVKFTTEEIDRINRNNSNGRIKADYNRKQKRIERWNSYYREAEEEFEDRCKEPIFLIGLSLYIGEGTKSGSSEIILTSCDYRILKKGVEFYKSLGIKESNIKISYQYHEDVNLEEANKWWSKKLNIPLSQFGKPSLSKPISSSNKKRNIQTYGTCKIIVCDTKLKQKINKWMNMLLENSSSASL